MVTAAAWPPFQKQLSFPWLRVIRRLLVLVILLLAAGTVPPDHPPDQKSQNAQSRNSSGSGNSAFPCLGRLSRRSGRFLGMQGAGQEKSRQCGSGKHAVLEKEMFHL